MDRRSQAFAPQQPGYVGSDTVVLRAGYETLSLGRSDLEHEGLRRFKASWGAEEKECVYFRYDIRSGKPVPGTR